MEFYIGQKFIEEYPFEAALWCNETGESFIEEVESENGKRMFEIKQLPEPSEQDLLDIEIDKIKMELYELDLKSIRAMRAGDVDYIKHYEEMAVDLRKKLVALGR